MAAFTYVQFHAAFVLPALSLLVAAAGVGRERSEVRPLAVAVIVAIALVYTTPWDNYLIDRGVWSYAEGSVAATVWLAPVEEYLFVLLQPLLAALWLHQVAPAYRDRGVTVDRRDRAVGAAAGALVGLCGLALLRSDPTFYLGATLAWAGPVLALQWAVGWPYLVERWRALLAGVAGPTVYLWAADLIAIRAGLWTIAPAYATGLSVAGLPVEEMVFFLVTNCFVVQGLLLYPWVVDRWQSR